MYDRILFPTDGSEGSAAALDHAVGQALAHDASLHVIYVVEENLPGIAAGSPDLYSILEERGEQALEDARNQARLAGVKSIEGTIGTGSPYRVIIEYADEQDVDLIVMGTHGRRGIDRYLLGSVAEKVVRTANCPVLTVRAQPQPTED